MIIETKLDPLHIELIKIFIKANELVGIVINEHPVELNGRFHMCIIMESTFPDTSEKLTFMGLRHCGICNMLDDFLIKCGVDPQALQPKSMGRQMQEEREEKINAEFMASFKGKIPVSTRNS